MSEVRYRGGFSDRNGIKVENNLPQLYELDERTRVLIGNFIREGIDKFYPDPYWNEGYQKFIRFVKGSIYVEPVSSQRYDLREFSALFNETIKKGTYDDILTVFEAVIRYGDCTEKQGYMIYQSANKLLEKEFVGYRFINGVL